MATVGKKKRCHSCTSGQCSFETTKRRRSETPVAEGSRADPDSPFKRRKLDEIVGAMDFMVDTMGESEYAVETKRLVDRLKEWRTSALPVEEGEATGN